MGTEVLKPAAKASPTAKRATVGAKNPYVEDKTKVSDHLDEDESVSSNSDMKIDNNASEEDESDEDRSDVSGSKKPKAKRKYQTPYLSCIPKKKQIGTKK